MTVQERYELECRRIVEAWDVFWASDEALSAYKPQTTFEGWGEPEKDYSDREWQESWTLVHGFAFRGFDATQLPFEVAQRAVEWGYCIGFPAFSNLLSDWSDGLKFSRAFSTDDQAERQSYLWEHGRADPTAIPPSLIVLDTPEEVAVEMAAHQTRLVDGIERFMGGGR